MRTLIIASITLTAFASSAHAFSTQLLEQARSNGTPGVIAYQAPPAWSDQVRGFPVYQSLNTHIPGTGKAKQHMRVQPRR